MPQPDLCLMQLPLRTLRQQHRMHRHFHDKAEDDYAETHTDEAAHRAAFNLLRCREIETAYYAKGGKLRLAV